jgi:hypothetical protein
MSYVGQHQESRMVGIENKTTQTDEELMAQFWQKAK